MAYGLEVVFPQVFATFLGVLENVISCLGETPVLASALPQVAQKQYYREVQSMVDSSRILFEEKFVPP